MNSASATVVPGILVVGDGPVLLGTVKNYLERVGMSAQACRDGLAALDLVRATTPNMVVLDLSLPGTGGVEVCRQLRAFSDRYALMLTAHADEVDKLVGLSVGADDYMTKLLSSHKLVARIQALLRRPCTGSTGTTAAVVHHIGTLTLDPSSRRAELDASPVELTHTEFSLLQVLTKRPGQVLNRRQLIDTVWGEGWADDDRLVDVHIAHLRKRLGNDPFQPRFMQTMRGVDYRMGQGQ